MIEPKPLSNQRMGEIATYIQYRLHDMGGAEFDQMLAEQEELLSDATFWREHCMSRGAVWIGRDRMECEYCGAFKMARSLPDEGNAVNRKEFDGSVEHKSDCAWLLAQDGE